MSKLFSRDSWAEIIEALSSNWFRTILTAFGVLWGIFILVILLAAGNGLENGIKQAFTGMATNSMFMWAQNVSQPYKGLPKGRRYNFKLDDVQAIKEQVPGLRYVSPRNQLGGFRGENNVVRGLQSGAFNVYGDYPEITQQQPMEITSGRFVNYSDINERRKVAIIGSGVQNALYDIGEEVMLGFTVTVRNKETGKERPYTLVTEEERHLVDNAASAGSPVGQALMGKKVGDTVEVQGPNGVVYFEILNIEG